MNASVPSLPDRVRGLLLSSTLRPLRFAGTVSVAGAVQILLLLLFTRHGWHALVANGMAFLLAAQVNFALSVAFTWRDRLEAYQLPRRWALFHGSIALMALVNMLVFAATRSFLPVPVASLAGIAAGSLGNYLLGDRLVFRGSDGSLTPCAGRRVA